MLMRVLRSTCQQLSSESPFLTVEAFLLAWSLETSDILSELVLDLSTLDVCLLIAVKHLMKRGMLVFNFEMVYEEYRQFTKRLASTGRGGGGVFFHKQDTLVAFEYMQHAGLIVACKNVSCPKEYRMVHLTNLV